MIKSWIFLIVVSLIWMFERSRSEGLLDENTSSKNANVVDIDVWLENAELLSRIPVFIQKDNPNSKDGFNNEEKNLTDSVFVSDLLKLERNYP